MILFIIIFVVPCFLIAYLGLYYFPWAPLLIIPYCMALAISEEIDFKKHMRRARRIKKRIKQFIIYT